MIAPDLNNGYAQDLKKIIKSHFKALGQKELLNAETVTIIGKITQMGNEMPYKQIQKRPLKSYLEVDMEGNAMKQAYDGVTGWMIAPWTGSNDPQMLSGPELKSIKNAANIDGELYQWRKKGHILEFQGMKNKNDSDYYHLKLIKKDGDDINYFIDKGTYLISSTLINTEVGGVNVKIEQIFKDYQEFDGIMFPSKIEMKYDNELTTTIRVDSVKVNEPVDDHIFEMP